MEDAAKRIYDSLNSYKDLESLILEGESEGLYLECKAPTKPKLSREQKQKLAIAVSGFNNTEGGVIIWGISTTNKAHDGLDIIAQIEPIGNCKGFLKIIETTIPTLTIHPITNFKNKIITKKKKDTKGIVITYIPKTVSDPVLNNKDNVFYFRCGDRFEPLPYELIKKLFAATSVPILKPEFNSDIVKIENDCWKIPIPISNSSYALARDVMVSINIINYFDCDNISISQFNDVSYLNLGKRIFNTNVQSVIYKGSIIVVGELTVKMKKQKRTKRLLKIKIDLFADRMIAKSFLFSINLAKSKFSVKSLGIEEVK